MFRHEKMKIAVIAAGIVAAGMAAAAPAVADQAQDDQYFAALQQIYPGRSLVQKPNIDNAHVICDHLAKGGTFDAVAGELHAADNNRSSLDQAQQEVRLAQSTFCP